MVGGVGEWRWRILDEWVVRDSVVAEGIYIWGSWGGEGVGRDVPLKGEDPRKREREL